MTVTESSKITTGDQSVPMPPEDQEPVNGALPKLLRAMAESDHAKFFSHDILLNLAADEIDSRRALLATLRAAMGYLLNAKIDLQTGAPKRTAIQTIEGALKMIEKEIARAEGRSAS